MEIGGYIWWLPRDWKSLLEGISDTNMIRWTNKLHVPI